MESTRLDDAGFYCTLQYPQCKRCIEEIMANGKSTTLTFRIEVVLKEALPYLRWKTCDESRGMDASASYRSHGVDYV